MATEAHNDEIVVAVVGVTGSGKSSFIKRVTGNESIEIGHDLRSSQPHHLLQMCAADLHV